MAVPAPSSPSSGEIALPDPDMVHEYLQFVKRVQGPDDCLMVESLYDALLFPDYDQAPTPTERLHEALLYRETHRKGGFTQEADTWTVMTAKMNILKPVLKGMALGATIANNELSAITHHVTHTGMTLESGFFKSQTRPDLRRCFNGMRSHHEPYIAERSAIVYDALPPNPFVKALSRALGR